MFDFLPCKYTILERERYNDKTERKDKTDQRKCSTLRHENQISDVGFSCKELLQSCFGRCCQACERIEKKTKLDEIKCIDPSSSIVAARQKCPKKVIAANPAACLPRTSTPVR